MNTHKMFHVLHPTRDGQGQYGTKEARHPKQEQDSGR